MGGKVYYKLDEAEKLLNINLSEADYIEVMMPSEAKKTKFANKESIDSFLDTRELSGFNKLLKRAAGYNPNSNTNG
jgi:hypothetical protein